MQPGDVPKTEANVTDLIADLGYKPDTPITSGIDKFIDWYNSYFKILKLKDFPNSSPWGGREGLLGYKPDTSVKKGIGEFILWYKTYFITKY